MRLSRRSALAAAVAVGAAAAVADAPITAEEVRVLAKAATPREAWKGREEDYHQERAFDDGDATDGIVRELEARGLVRRRNVQRNDYPDMTHEVTATNAGMRALRRLGIVGDAVVRAWAEKEAS